MNNAREFTQNGNFVSAIETYQKALSQTPTTEIKAQCYQEISLIYASQKHYNRSQVGVRRLILEKFFCFFEKAIDKQIKITYNI